MSGHSKWSNIKRKKEKTDVEKAKIFTKIGRELAVAVKEGIVADGFQVFGQTDAGERLTTFEGRTADFLDLSCDVDTGESLAAVECL